MPDAPNTSNQNSLEKKSGLSSNFVLLLTVLVLILLAGGGFLGWQRWQQRQKQPAPPPALPSPAPSEPSPAPAPPPSPVPSAALKENIEAAINTMNTAALEGYMANPVTVILAASECCGMRTPTQAIADVNYLSGATAPWDWNLDQATLNSYKNGFYGQYFPAGAVVGKAANNYIVSFTVNANDKISGIFMAVNADLLQ